MLNEQLKKNIYVFLSLHLSTKESSYSEFQRVGTEYASPRHSPHRVLNIRIGHNVSRTLPFAGRHRTAVVLNGKRPRVVDNALTAAERRAPGPSSRKGVLYWRDWPSPLSCFTRLCSPHPAPRSPSPSPYPTPPVATLCRCHWCLVCYCWLLLWLRVMYRFRAWRRFRWFSVPVMVTGAFRVVQEAPANSIYRSSNSSRAAMAASRFIRFRIWFASPS